MSSSDEKRVGEARALRVQFLFFLVLSATGSIAFSLAGWHWWPMAWAAAGMFAYLLTARIRAPDEVTGEDFADSFYYLGFLLTLVALVSVLLQLGREEPGDELLKAVLSQFGLALVTTVIGLAGRVAILMFSTESDVSHSSQKKLERARDDLYDALNTMEVETRAFTERFAGNMQQVIHPVESQTKAFAAAVEESTGNVTEVGSRLEQLANRLERMSRDLGKAWQELSQRLAATHEEMEGALRGIQRDREISRQELDEMSQELRRSADTATGDMEAAVASLSQSTSRIDDDLKSLKSSVLDLPKALQENLEGSGSAAKQLMGQLTSLRANLEALSTSARKLEASFEDGGNRLHAGLDQWNVTQEELAQLQTDLARRTAEASDSLMTVREELGEAVAFLVEVVEQSADRAPRDG